LAEEGVRGWEGWVIKEKVMSLEGQIVREGSNKSEGRTEEARNSSTKKGEKRDEGDSERESEA